MSKIILEYERTQSLVREINVGEISTLSPVMKPRRVPVGYPTLIKRFPSAPKLAKSREVYKIRKREARSSSVNTSNKEMKIELPKVFIATKTSVPAGLVKTWKRIECVSVSAYFQTLTRAVAELKWKVNQTRTDTTTDIELLMAFGSAVSDKSKSKNYFVSACNLLMAELNDMDAAFRDPDEEDAW